MMTFKEFYNKRDSQPLSATLKPTIISGMSVVNDFKKSMKNPDFYTDPKAPMPHLPKDSHQSMLPYRRPIKDRPIERKPTDFLSRKKHANVEY
jgi:hypothetical protein